MSDWILYEEKKPEKFQECLVADEQGDIYLTQYLNSSFYIKCDCYEGSSVDYPKKWKPVDFLYDE